MTDRLRDKVAIVTGAGTMGSGWGNGKATAVLFAREGARVFLIDVDAEAVAETQRIIESEGGICAAATADVSKSDQVKASVDACLTRFGRIDILHNNVGIVVLGGPVELAEDDWDRALDVNLKSVYLTCKYVLPSMSEQRSGSIINISSIASRVYMNTPYITYAASKAGMNALTREIGLQYASMGIRCNCILPGLMKTPIVEDAVRKGYSHGTQVDVETFMGIRDRLSPTGQQGEPWDIAYAALFLASDESKYVNATELVVDGGIVGMLPHG